jgi:hypothetical protein
MRAEERETCTAKEQNARTAVGDGGELRGRLTSSTTSPDADAGKTETAERPGFRPRLKPHGRCLKDCRNQGWRGRHGETG